MNFRKYLPLVVLLGSATALTPLIAQTVEDETQPMAGLVIPQGIRVVANNPNLRRASARVDGEIITGTDIDQRIALLTSGNQAKLKPDELAMVRQQVLDTLIDETLKMHEATANEIEVKPEEVDKYFARAAEYNFKASPEEVEKILDAMGSSAANFKRQLKAQVAWDRVLGRNVIPNTKVSDAEVRGKMAQAAAEKGMIEYHIAEIYLPGTPDQRDALLKQAQNILDRLRAGEKFDDLAREKSMASTSARGGSLGWVKPDRLPTEMATAVTSMGVDEVVVVPAPNGISLVLLVDKRQVGTADPRDAKVSLKQLSIQPAKPLPEAEFRALQSKFSEAASKINGCGSADEAAKALGAEVVNNDELTIRGLPAQLQRVMLTLPVGRSTPAFDTGENGLLAFVLCGRDTPQAAPDETYDKVMDDIEQERIDRRARAYLRDLRRDAVIEYN